MDLHKLALIAVLTVNLIGHSLKGKTARSWVRYNEKQERDTVWVNDQLDGFRRSTKDSSWLPTLIQVREVSEAILYPQGLARSHFALGQYFSSHSRGDSAIKHFKVAKTLFDELSQAQDRIIHDYSLETRRKLAYQYLWLKPEGNDSALLYMQEALNMNEQFSSSQNSRTYSLFAHYFNKVHLGDSALKYAKMAIEVDPENLAGYDVLGQTYGRRGVPAKALETFLKGYELAKETKDDYMTNLLASNIGIFYTNHGEYEKALSYKLISLDYYKTHLPKSPNYANSLSVMYTLYAELGDFVKAKYYIELAITKAHSLNLTNQLPWFYLTQGTMYLEDLQLLDSARISFERSLEYGNLVDEKEASSLAYLGLADIEIAEGNWRKAIKSLLASEQLTNVTKIKRHQKELNKKLSKVYEGLGDYKRALGFYKKYKSQADSLFNAESIEKIARLESKSTAEKERLELLKQQEVEREILNARIEKETLVRDYAIKGLLLVLLACFIIYFLFRGAKKNVKTIKNQRNELLKLKTNRDNLTQMISHDLRNVLSTMVNITEPAHHHIPSKQLQHTSVFALNLIDNLVDVQRYEDDGFNLNKTKHSIHQLISNALANVKSLADSKDITFEVNFGQDFEVNVDGNIIIRTIYNILHNAIKFSSAGQSISIYTEYDETEDSLTLHLKDNGVGIDFNEAPRIFEKFWKDASTANHVSATGIGLSFCKMAMEAHGGTIDVKSEKGKGSVFSIRFEGVRKELSLAQIPTSPSELSANFRLSPQEIRLIQRKLPGLFDVKAYEGSKLQHYIQSVERLRIRREWVDKLKEAAAKCDQKLLTFLLNKSHK